MQFRAFSEGLLKRHGHTFRRLQRQQASPRKRIIDSPAHVAAFVEVVTDDADLSKRIVEILLKRYPKGAKRGVLVWEIIGLLPAERIVSSCEARVREYATRDIYFDLEAALQSLQRYAQNLRQRAEAEFHYWSAVYSYVNLTPFELQELKQDVYREKFACPFLRYVHELLDECTDGTLPSHLASGLDPEVLDELCEWNDSLIAPDAHASSCATVIPFRSPQKTSS